MQREVEPKGVELKGVEPKEVEPNEVNCGGTGQICAQKEATCAQKEKEKKR
jgi:hypothetical protein